MCCHKCHRQSKIHTAISDTPSSDTNVLLQPSPYYFWVSCEFSVSTFCFFSLYVCLLHVFLYDITPPQFCPTYLSVSTHFHLSCSHYYILLGSFLLSALTFSNFHTYFCHTYSCSCVFCPDLLNSLYSHHHFNILTSCLSDLTVLKS